MPELTSPSGHIFPHPERRLVSLSPEGPISIAFWRWTIKPEGPSAILEPIEFSFFDTRERVMRDVVISPQRVAMAPGPAPVAASAPPEGGSLHRASGLTALAAGAIAGVAAMGWRRTGRPADWRELRQAFSARRNLARAARSGDLPAFRRAAHRMAATMPADQRRPEVLAEIDAALFVKEAATPDLRDLRRRLLGLAGRAA
jgi:hypothetical protein